MPLWQSLAASGILGTAPITRHAFLAATPENFTYDLDGNLTDDGRWSYAWDGENRLVKIETSLATIVIATGVPRQRITFAYDYLGRRVRKTVAKWKGSAYITAVDRKFIYDGWNLIAEYNAVIRRSAVAPPWVAPTAPIRPPVVITLPSVLLTTYVWGLDLSKTLQDGGGVGGLLAIKLHAEPGAPVLLPAYDGNGNIAALVNRAGGALLAAYEYDAFGQTIRASGTHADKNNFRFSTKYTDAETGLLYYGRRYYNPTLGRWLGRDPIAEKGGLHLYGFVGNNGVNAWDVLGMWGNDDGTYVFKAGDTNEDYLGIPVGFHAVSSTHACPFGYSSDGESNCVADPNAPTGPRSGATQMAPFKVSAGGGGPSYGTAGGGGQIGLPVGNPLPGISSPSPSVNAPNIERWKPNKADCDALREAHADLFKKPGESINSPLQASIAASIAVGVETYANSWEYSSTIYKNDEDGTYSFTSPTRTLGSSAAGGGVIINNNPRGTTVIAYPHGHNVGFTTYRANNPGVPPLLYDSVSNTFSPADQRFSRTTGVPLLIYTSTDSVRSFNSKIDQSSLTSNAIGREVISSPSAETMNKISKCINF